MRTRKFDSSGYITDSNNPTLYQVKLTLEDEDDELTIYDNDSGEDDETEIAFLDKTNPSIDFFPKGQVCHKGLYAELLGEGSFYVTWDD